MGDLVAPWTDEQVTALNAFQRRGYGHPFTCDSGDRSDGPHREHALKHNDRDHGLLVATNEGWRCPACGYRQNWARAGMVDPRALINPFARFRSAPAIEAGTAETGGLGAQHESAVTEGQAPKPTPTNPASSTGEAE